MKLIHFVKVMAHAGLLGVHVKLVVAIRFHFDGHVLDHLEAIALQTNALDGIVGHQTHLGHAQNAQDISTDAIVALVRLEAQVHIGVNSVKTMLLQFVGFDLVH